MKRKHLIFILLIILGFFLSSNVFAQNPERFDGKMGRRFDKVLDELQLTNEQKESLQKNRTKHREKVKELMGKIHEKRKELHQEIGKREMDVSKVKNIHEELKILLMEQEDVRLEGILSVRKILTQEQISQFKERMKKLRKKHMFKREKRNGKKENKKKFNFKGWLK